MAEPTKWGIASDGMRMIYELETEDDAGLLPWDEIPEGSFTADEIADWQEVSERYDAWQDRLEELWKRHHKRSWA